MLLRENISNTGRTILWISGQKNKAQPSTQVVGYALYSLTILHSTIFKGNFFQNGDFHDESQLNNRTYTVIRNTRYMM